MLKRRDIKVSNITLNNNPAKFMVAHKKCLFPHNVMHTYGLYVAQQAKIVYLWKSSSLNMHSIMEAPIK